MNKLMPWVKSNLVIVIAIVLAIIVIPVLIYFGASWESSLRDQIRQDVSRSMSQLQGVNVTYEIPALLPGQQAWSQSSVPSMARTNRVAEALDELREASERGRRDILDRNRGTKAPLIDGATPEQRLFPQPSNPQTAVRLPTEFVRQWPRSLRSLLEAAQAGDAPSPEDVQARLEARFERLRNQRLSGRVTQELTDEERAEIRAQLGIERRELYQQHASRLLFYTDPQAFGSYSEVRAAAAATTPATVEQCWEWQWRLWIYEDIVDAIAYANRDEHQMRPFIPLYEAPIKRLMSVRVDPHSESTPGGQRGGGSRDPYAGLGDDMGGGGGASGFSVAHTGRAAWPNNPSNQLYDIRYVTLQMVADANRLPTIIDAISSTNFMTVIGADVVPFNPEADLANGYVYTTGDGAIAVMTLRIETIWLREWMKPYMPPSVRTKLGIPEDAPEGVADDGQDDGF
ncbi:MAG: hypothetical protein EA380_07755 [Phycisphaeraceae bacterium]|nr:MAG: hypothetical protein EA380_07755 [Phycisphaeraceae bacterium]